MLVSGILCSCDSSEDYFAADNAAPEISYKAEGDYSYNDFSADTVKLSNSYYDLYFKIEDEENLDLTIETELRYEIYSDNDYVRFALDEEGTFSVGISCMDSWELSDNKYFNLVIYGNTAPIASLVVTQIEGREWEIDASGSYDQDDDDEIATYRYFVNDKEIDKTYHSSINYIFPKDTTYEVGLQVQDNNGTWSEEVTQTINIE